MLQAVRDARTPEARKDALVALEARGLPALPGVLRLLKGTAPEDPSQADVRSLARRMALIVREVRFGDSSVKPGDDLRKMVESLRGRPMTRPALLKLLRSATTSLPAESSGVAITLERPGEGTGAVLTVTLLPRRPAREGTFPPLAIREKILRGERTIHNMTRGIGGIGREVGLAEVVWEDISKGLATGLEAAPEEYLLIQVRCVETH